MIHDTQSAQISQKRDGRNIYAIMKTMCPPGYHHNGFVATHAFGHMMYGYILLVPMNQIFALLVEHSLVNIIEKLKKIHKKFNGITLKQHNFGSKATKIFTPFVI